MNRLLLIFLLALPALAQNSPTFALLQAALQPCRSLSGNRAVLSISGLTVCATLGTNLTYDFNTNTLNAAASGPSITFVDAEVPAGAINGANATFTLANTPVAGSLRLYRNGVKLRLGLDYNLAGAAITFLTAAVPQTGDWLEGWYRR